MLIPVPLTTTASGIAAPPATATSQQMFFLQNAKGYYGAGHR